MVRNLVLTLFLVTLFATSVEASTLFGRVIEVNDGDVITVFNLNRPVRIKLLAVDAPEEARSLLTSRRNISRISFTTNRFWLSTGALPRTAVSSAA